MGKLSKSYWLGFFLVPLSSELNMPLSSGYKESISHMRVLWSVTGRRVGGGQSDLPASAFKFSICQDAIFWDSMS